jgi:hypothetical protein
MVPHTVLHLQLFGPSSFGLDLLLEVQHRSCVRTHQGRPRYVGHRLWGLYLNGTHVVELLIYLFFSPSRKKRIALRDLSYDLGVARGLDRDIVIMNFTIVVLTNAISLLLQ